MEVEICILLALIVDTDFMVTRTRIVEVELYVVGVKNRKESNEIAIIRNSMFLLINKNHLVIIYHIAAATKAAIARVLTTERPLAEESSILLESPILLESSILS